MSNRSHPRRALALAAAAAGLVALVPAHAAAHGDDEAAAYLGPPRSGAEAGLVFQGLRAASRGPCRGGFVVEDSSATVGCSHGPDPAPPSASATEPPSIPALREAVREEGAGGEVDCIGDGSSGTRVEAVYAHASDLPDRYSVVAPLIREILGAMTTEVKESAAESDGYRTIRVATSSCQPVVRDVTLSPAGDDSIGASASELEAQGLDASDRDYVMFVDATVYCGIGYVNFHYARIDTACWSSHSALHELEHNLGAVQLSAPNSSGGFHCTDESDVMCYSDEPYYPLMRQVCPLSHELLLDCGQDDYFSTDAKAGSYLALNPFSNTAESPFLGERDGEPPVWLPNVSAATGEYRGPTYSVRSFNSDQELCAYGESTAALSRVRLFCVGDLGERSADVTGALLSLAGAERKAKLELVGSSADGGQAFGFTVTKDGAPILDEHEGEAGVWSSSRPFGAIDPGTGLPSFYDKTIEVDLRDEWGPNSEACGEAQSRLAAAAAQLELLEGRATLARRRLAALRHRVRRHRRRASRARHRRSAPRARHRSRALLRRAGKRNRRARRAVAAQAPSVTQAQAQVHLDCRA